METRDDRGIERLLVVWTAAVLVAFVSLAIAFLITSAKLFEAAEVMHTDSSGLEANHAFELSVLTHRREDLLWRLTGDESHRKLAAEGLAAMDGEVARLWGAVTTEPERKVVRDVEASYRAFRAALADGDLNAIQPYVARLLERIDVHRVMSNEQMEASLAESRKLGHRVRIAAVGLALAGAAILLVGAFSLWSRIFRPILALARAAEAIGAGRLDARVPVVRRDEMGALTVTFNTMADALRHRERDRHDFVAGIAHDLKNPVVAIGGGARCLAQPDVSPAEREQWLEILEERAGFMESLLDDLMDSLKVETGRVDLRREAFDLAELVGTVVRQQSASAPAHTLRWAGSGRCPVVGDRRRLERVVLNLLSNAVKYSPSGSAIDVGLEHRDDRAILAVTDRGIGIAPEDLDRVFAPFTRLDGARTMAGGMGLGLPNARKLVEAHDGTIRIASRPGEGTTVTVELPLGSGPP